MSKMLCYLVFVFFFKLCVQVGQTQLSDFRNDKIPNLGLHNSDDISNERMDYGNSLHIKGKQNILN